LKKVYINDKILEVLGGLNLKRFKPTYKIDKVSNIPFVLLERDNIKGIMFDVDNTLTTMGRGIAKENEDWLQEAKKLGYNICLVSNTINIKKVRRIMNDLKVHGLCFARKPSTKGLKMALNLMDLKKEEVILVGDQLFTDVWSANRFGIKSILVNPLSKKEGPFTLIKRPFERLVLKLAEKESSNG
jgi:HAD superfamily phosphatase (TIGR01668 family)